MDLGAAASYSVLAGTSVANTGPGTVLAGDLGLSPAGPITGFPPGTVNGTIHDKDAAAEAAQSDRADAYADAAGQESTTTFAGDQAGATFHPGVHTTAAAFSNTGTMTLDADGDSNAVFIFQINAALSSAAGSKVVLTDGALANNVYWQVVGAISLGADAKYVGTFLGAGAIAFGDGASLKGRALTPTSVAMTNTPFLVAKDDLTAPLVTIDGGAARSTNDSTPTISGTTDEQTGTVRVTVGGQALTTTVGAGGIWAVSATALASGAHGVVAAITDASQNVGTAQQELTVDQTAPIISIDGPTTRATNDTTPEISGTTDAAPGTPVTVTVDGQTLTTEAGGDTGAWTVTTGILAEDAHSAVASMEDGAGNTATATQVLVVDLTVPVVTIDGGAVRSTDDTSPWTYGTTAERAGTTVHLTIGGQHLTATVEAGGAWGVSAATLPGGTHDVVASVTDAAQNTGTATQALTINVPGPDPAYRPDAAVRRLGGSLVGIDRYDDHQRVTSWLAPPGLSVSFEVRVTNRGDAPDRMKILATPGNGRFKVTYHAASDQNVTRGVTSGTYRTGTLQPGASTVLSIKVTRTRVAQPGDRRTFAVRADSSHAGEWDQVLAVVKR
ncbi:ice-binding family protein [Nocardioides bizhenqiangii]|uniref:Ice-binding family protein n=1 Tax=Nocardioides bizhenqiangii TaxID=3095076 RepID=A0ABZ0ZS49_9ACTN|nr:ice-binding family protein [Nocardioides sp. HM61]WQQ27160.1 ice-binding family protein [Nocardioides sp. HM61]